MGTTEEMWPFKATLYQTERGAIQCYHCSAEDRRAAVMRMTDRTQLEASLKVPGVQKSVISAINRRMRQLGFIGQPT